MGFWTRVRLPSGPLQHERSNTVQIRSIAVLKHEFGIMLDTSGYDAEAVVFNGYPFTYAGIRRWVKDNHDVEIGNSSITAVKNKCRISEMNFHAGNEPEADTVKTKNEKLVLEAFRALGIV